MDPLGLDAGGMLLGASLAVWLAMLLFWIVAPVGGFLMYRYLIRKFPMADTLALLAGAFCLLLISFACTLLALLRFMPGLDSWTAIFISLLAGVLVTVITAGLVWGFSNRRVKSNEDHAFRVWDEDQRQRKTSHHKKR